MRVEEPEHTLTRLGSRATANKISFVLRKIFLNDILEQSDTLNKGLFAIQVPCHYHIFAV